MTAAILLHLTESSPEPLRSQIARQLRNRISRLGPLAWLDEVLEEVQRLTGPVLDDDWTAVAVQRRRDPAPDAESPAQGVRPAAGGRP